MPSDLRKVSWVAVVLLVLLRISIGWHLFYEGIWKLDTQSSAAPWTAEGYLKNATGPMRKTFREMTGDPNDMKWLDFNGMSAKWDAWRDRFVKHYRLEGKQLEDLNKLLDGPGTDFKVGIEELPAEIDFDEVVKTAGVAKGAIKYDAKAKQLIVDGKLHLLPTERAKLRDAILAKLPEEFKQDPDDKEKKTPIKALPPAFDNLLKAIDRLSTVSSRLSYRERLGAMLNADPDRVGVVQKGKNDDEEQVIMVAPVKYYQSLIDRYEANYAKAKTKFQWDHLTQQWTELQQKRNELVGPVKALEKDLFEDANKILTEKQLVLGPVPRPSSPMSRVDAQTMWGLTIVGLLLMIGLFTRLSALGGAGLLTMFYLAMPPWPGVQEIPSIEHNVIVNKVFVEAAALLALAALPSGKWFGIDAAISALISRFRREK